MCKYATTTLVTEAFQLVNSSTAAFNDCYSELMPYTTLDNFY